MNISFHLNGEIGATQTLVSSSLKEASATRRRSVLKRVDRELLKGNYKAALSLVKQLQGKPGGLRGFGAAKQFSNQRSHCVIKQRIRDRIASSIQMQKIPQGVQSLDDLNMQGSDILYLHSLLDSILDSIKDSVQLSLSDELSLLELESLMRTESGDYPLNYHLKCMQHEAGHFLVGYLLGVLPKGYKVPSMKDLNQDKFAAGRVDFLRFEFLNEVDTERMSNYKFTKEKLFDESVSRILSVIVGGLVAEHMVFGCSEGLHSDVGKLYEVLKRWDFTEDEAESQLKCAALNTVLILDHHREARSRLAEAMALGRSVGFCIDTIENTLNHKNI